MSNSGATDMGREGRPVAPLDDGLLRLGGHVLLAILLWQDWCHRKVDSLSLLEGERARRRISLDCTPRSIDWVGAAETPAPPRQGTLVPLTLMGKQLLRDFDVTDDSGRSIPVLGSVDNSKVAAAVLANLVAPTGDFSLARRHWADLLQIAGSVAEDAAAKAEELIQKFNLNLVAARIFRDLSQNFIMLAVLPHDARGSRTVLKYSYHWQTSAVDQLGTRWIRLPRRFVKTVLAGFGFIPLSIEINLHSADSARSYHLECVAPPGLMCSRMQLPEDDSGTIPADNGRTPVGHVKGNYAMVKTPPASAVVTFLLDATGVLTRSIVFALWVTVLFVVLLIVPHAWSYMEDGMDAATSLLLFLPALLLALNARGTENAFVSRFLLPLRMSSGTLSLLLVIAGALLVLKVPEAQTAIYWLVAGIVAGIIFVLTFIGYVLLRVRGGR